MKKLIVALAILLPALAPAANAAPAKAVLCAACHGANGKASIAGYPNLAGQRADYMVAALEAYAAKQRTGTTNALTMQAQAGLLSRAEMEELAAYFANM